MATFGVHSGARALATVRRTLNPLRQLITETARAVVAYGLASKAGAFGKIPGDKRDVHSQGRARLKVRSDGFSRLAVRSHGRRERVATRKKQFLANATRCLTIARMVERPDPPSAVQKVSHALVRVTLVLLVFHGPSGVAAPPTQTAAVGVAPAAGGGSDTKATFEEAANSFKYQDFDNAVPQLRALLYPTPRVDRRREWQAREYLGASLWWVGSKNEANDEFTALLVRDSGHKLDPAVYPPKMVADFEHLRDNLVRLGVIKGVVQIPDPPDDTAHPPPYGLMFMPFGVGQFANRSPGKGTAFLVTEALLAGVSATFYYINQRDGLKGPGHMTTVNEATQLSAGGAFFAVAIVGIIEAAVSWNATPK